MLPCLSLEERVDHSAHGKRLKEKEKHTVSFLDRKESSCQAPLHGTGELEKASLQHQSVQTDALGRRGHEAARGSLRGGQRPLGGRQEGKLPKTQELEVRGRGRGQSY